MTECRHCGEAIKETLGMWHHLESEHLECFAKTVAEPKEEPKRCKWCKKDIKLEHGMWLHGSGESVGGARLCDTEATPEQEAGAPTTIIHHSVGHGSKEEGS